MVRKVRAPPKVKRGQKPKRVSNRSRPKSRSSQILVFCDVCGKDIIRSDAIRHHVDPSRKTKEPSALGKADIREKNDLIFVCRQCHGKIHAKLQHTVKYVDENGKNRIKRIYTDQNFEASIWRQ